MALSPQEHVEAAEDHPQHQPKRQIAAVQTTMERTANIPAEVAGSQRAAVCAILADEVEAHPAQKLVIGKIDFDLSAAWDTEAEREFFDLFVEKLKALGMYRPNLLYRGFNGERVKIIKKHGTDNPDSNTTWCSTASELSFDDDSGNALRYALLTEKSGLAIYDGEKLEGGIGPIPYLYKPKEGGNFKKALLAIFILRK